MLANKSRSSPAEKSCISKIATDLHTMTHTYKNGQIKGVLRRSPFVPATEDPGITGVATRDAVVDRDTGLSARLFLPTGAVATGRRLPLVLFFHGCSSCSSTAESAFCHTYHRYATALAARAGALVVSVEYRLAPPEHHPITAACDDAWTALRWAASSGDPWLLYYADRRCAFVSGDGAGGTVAYHTAVRAGWGGEDIDVEGVVLVHPCFFLGAEWLMPSEKAGHGGSLTPQQVAEIASLKSRHALVAEKRVLWQRERRFVVSLSGSWWGGKVTVVDLHSEEHAFHLCGTASGSVEKLMESIVEFVNKKGPMLHEKNGVSSSGVMDCAEDVGPCLSNGPCKAVTVDVPRRTVTKSCL